MGVWEAQVEISANLDVLEGVARQEWNGRHVRQFSFSCFVLTGKESGLI
jgi:hypothetical protein